MDEERLIVLRMLEEGKITAAEAAELLRALDEGRAARPAEGRAPEAQASARAAERLAEIAREIARRSEELAERLTRRSEELAERVGARAGQVAEVIERTVERALRRIPEQFAALEHLVEVFEPPLRLERTLHGGFAGEGPVTVELGALGGTVQVEAWDEPRYRLVLSACVPAHRRPAGGDGRHEGAGAEDDPLSRHVRIEQRPDGLLVQPVGDLRSLSLSLRLPRGPRYRLRLHSANGPVLVAGVAGERLEAFTGNGRIAAEGIAFEEALLETSNGRIAASGAVRRLTAQTANAGIAAEPDLGRLEGESTWVLRTSNGGIRCRIPVGDAFGYDVDAVTTLGRIEVETGSDRRGGEAGGRPYLGRHVVAVRTPGFEQRPHRLVLRVRTTNGSIQIGPGVVLA